MMKRIVDENQVNELLNAKRGTKIKITNINTGSTGIYERKKVVSPFSGMMIPAWVKVEGMNAQDTFINDKMTIENVLKFNEVEFIEM